MTLGIVFLLNIIIGINFVSSAAHDKTTVKAAFSCTIVVVEMLYFPWESIGKFGG